jgi:hypothetical protein
MGARRSRTASHKAMSLRLAGEQAAELSAVARTDEMPVSEAVREAIDKHIADRKADPVFQKRLKAILEADQKTLERLAAGLGAKDDIPF